MTDEELRMFCLEQAVSLFIHAERARAVSYTHLTLPTNREG